MRQTLAAAVLLPIIQYLIVGLIYIGLPFWAVYSPNSCSFFPNDLPANCEFTSTHIESHMEISLPTEPLAVPDCANVQNTISGDQN
jgi:hypothetical protein